LHPRPPLETGVAEPDFAHLYVDLRPHHPTGASLEMDGAPRQLRRRPIDGPLAVSDRQRIHATALRRLAAVHADVATWALDHGRDPPLASAEQNVAEIPRGRDGVWHGRPWNDVHGQHADGNGEYDRHPEAARAVAARHDPREAAGQHGCRAAI